MALSLTDNSHIDNTKYVIILSFGKAQLQTRFVVTQKETVQ
jgi:hypothetical protein